MKHIQLTRGMVAIIDDEDFDKVSEFKWHYMEVGYAARNSSGRKQYLHRFLMGEPNGMQVDHISLDKLDNRKGNLRLATHSQNKCNVPLFPNNTSGHKGVMWDASRRKWRAEIEYEKRKHYLGRFDNISDAILARSKAAVMLHGEFARLN